MNRMLSKYVTEEMATYSKTAIEYKITNQFDDTTFKNACNASKLLVDTIVDYYKKQNSNTYVIITSFLRVPLLNERIGGSRTSRHCFGDAVDMTISCASRKQLFNDIISGRIKQSNGQPLKNIIDQVIYEGTWVHVALNSSLSKPRNMFLIANFVNGKPTYLNVSEELK